jgi:hypothetical protein
MPGRLASNGCADQRRAFRGRGPVDRKVAEDSKLLDRDDIMCVQAAYDDASRGEDNELVAVQHEHPALRAMRQRDVAPPRLFGVN